MVGYTCSSLHVVSAQYSDSSALRINLSASCPSDPLQMKQQIQRLQAQLAEMEARLQEGAAQTEARRGTREKLAACFGPQEPWSDSGSERNMGVLMQAPAVPIGAHPSSQQRMPRAAPFFETPTRQVKLRMSIADVSWPAIANSALFVLGEEDWAHARK